MHPISSSLFVCEQVVRAGALFLHEASTDPETQVRLGRKGVDPNRKYCNRLKTLHKLAVVAFMIFRSDYCQPLKFELITPSIATDVPGLFYENSPVRDCQFQTLKLNFNLKYSDVI